VDVVQSVRTSDCGSEGRGFEPHLPPGKNEGSCNSMTLLILNLRLQKV
jgi:hypothetical protein